MRQRLDRLEVTSDLGDVHRFLADRDSVRGIAGRRRETMQRKIRTRANARLRLAEDRLPIHLEIIGRRTRQDWTNALLTTNIFKASQSDIVKCTCHPSSPFAKCARRVIE